MQAYVTLFSLAYVARNLRATEPKSKGPENHGVSILMVPIRDQTTSPTGGRAAAPPSGRMEPCHPNRPARLALTTTTVTVAEIYVPSGTKSKNNAMRVNFGQGNNARLFRINSNGDTRAAGRKFAGTLRRGPGGGAVAGVYSVLAQLFASP